MRQEASFATATVEFSVADQPIHTEITLPNRPVRPLQMLPIFNRFAEIVIDLAVERSEAEGKNISCKAGCGACCRQLVPLSETEGVHIAEVVQNLPEPRRSIIKARFIEARKRLSQSGMLDRLRKPSDLEGVDVNTFGLEYFHLGIACPFLEDESCSIHEVRPISCREYLVTSPAEHCAKPQPGTVHCVPLGATVSKVVKSLVGKPTGRILPWVPMILADEWAERHDEPAMQPAPELLRLFLERWKEQQSAMDKPAVL
jgi:Fe-S-cluster containining protein